MSQTTDKERRRGPLDWPSLDWPVAALTVLVVVKWTPLIDLFVKTDNDGQRSAMSSVSSLLANVAAFGVAALFAFSALSNPTAQKMRARWGGHLAGVFLRALAAMFLAAAVAGVCAVTVPNPAGAIVFLSAIVVGTVKLVRVLLTVASLLHGQREDAREALRPVAEVVEDTEDRPV